MRAQRLTRGTVGHIAAACLLAVACDGSTGPGESSPDARPIVYFRQDNAGNGAWLLYRVSAAGGAPTHLSSTGEATTFPAISPDGSRLAFVKEGSPYGIYVATADGSGARQVYEGLTDHIAWSPDGSKLAFSVAGEIVVVGVDGGGADTITSAVDVHAGYPSWSPTGRIAFSTSGDIYTITPDGSDLRLIVPGDGQQARDPTWSPDGSRLAYAWGHYTDSWIYTVDPNGNDRRRVTFSSLAPGPIIAATDLGPAWAPSGRWITFQREHSVCTAPPQCQQRYDVFIVRTDGGDLRNLTQGTPWGGVRPSW
jgi:Tol biopolymer transport system component